MEDTEDLLLDPSIAAKRRRLVHEEIQSQGQSNENPENVRTGEEMESGRETSQTENGLGDGDQMQTEVTSDEDDEWSVDRLMRTFDSAEAMKVYIERTHDESLLRFLAKLQGPRMERFSARKKLSHVNDLKDVQKLLRTSQKVLVLTGAGVSVSAGIPDFRSADGIYSRLKREYDMPSPTCMFDKTYFNENPGPFFSFANELWPGRFEPTPSHRFIAELEKQGKLLRNYTQNIDTLEQRAGIKRVIACHGSFATATCVTCKKKVDGALLADDIMEKRIARCTSCAICDGDGSASFGVMKPDIVFFGESLPDVFYSSLESDLPQADLMLVIGTSLRVAPVSEILPQLPRNVPVVLINREVVGHPHEFDVELLGDSDAVVAHLCADLQVSTMAFTSNADNSSGSGEGTAVVPTESKVVPLETSNLDEAREIVQRCGMVRWAPRPSTFLFRGFLPPPESRESSPVASSRGEPSDVNDESSQGDAEVGTLVGSALSDEDVEADVEGTRARAWSGGREGDDGGSPIQDKSSAALDERPPSAEPTVANAQAGDAAREGGYDESWGVQRPRPNSSIMGR